MKEQEKPLIKLKEGDDNKIQEAVEKQGDVLEALGQVVFKAFKKAEEQTKETE